MGEQRLLESIKIEHNVDALLFVDQQNRYLEMYRECIYLCAQRGLLVYPIDKMGILWDNEKL